MDSLEVKPTSLHTVNEEKDYIFLKKLNVIYIDNDIQAHKIIINHIRDTICITASDSTLYSI